MTHLGLQYHRKKTDIISSPLSVYSFATQGPAEDSTNPTALTPAYTSTKLRNFTSLAVSFYIHMFPPVFILGARSIAVG